MQTLQNKRILVTAGPTYEPIDPVRFIGNRSSGKMGIALCNVLANKGTNVLLIAGCISIPDHIDPSVQRIDVNTAKEMYEACLQHYPLCDGAIMAAAVSDYTIANPSSEKIKKNSESLILTLVKTEDILKKLGSIKKPNQFLVGFALETNNELEHANNKLIQKKADIIVLNSLRDQGAGFQVDSNKVTIIDRYNKIKKYRLKTKKEVAEDIVEYIESYLNINA